MAKSASVTIAEGPVGPPKSEQDLILSERARRLSGGMTEEYQTKYAERKNRGVGDDGPVGPPKSPLDYYLVGIQDEDANLLLSDFAKAHPKAVSQGGGERGKDEELQYRKTQEALLGLGSGELSSDSTLVGQVYHKKLPQGLLQQQRAGLSPEMRRIESIDELGLDAGQRARFDALVEAGDIDPKEVFSNTNIGGIVGSLFRGFNAKGTTGLTTEQALFIVAGGREGISKFNPVTGMTWTDEEISASKKLRQKVMAAQGFPLPVSQMTLQGFGRDRLPFQHLPSTERETNKRGEYITQNPRQDALYNHLTLEEELLVMEMLTGRQRLYGRAQAGSNDPNLDETLLYGQYVL